MPQIRNDEMVGILSADFQRRHEPNFSWSSVVAAHLALPGLRGFWPMSSSNESGQALDLSGQGRALSVSSVPLYGHTSLTPWVEFDGTNDYLYRSDESGLDISGADTYTVTANRGLTLGGWFYFDVHPTAAQYTLLIGKWTPYSITHNLNTVYFNLHDGAVERATTTVTVSTKAWHHIVARYTPSTEEKIWVNWYDTGVRTANVPASLANTANAFVIGNASVTKYLDGKASMCFLCAQALSDMTVFSLYEQSRALFSR